MKIFACGALFWFFSIKNWFKKTVFDQNSRPKGAKNFWDENFLGWAKTNKKHWSAASRPLGSDALAIETLFSPAEGRVSVDTTGSRNHHHPTSLPTRHENRRSLAFLARPSGPSGRHIEFDWLQDIQSDAKKVGYTIGNRFYHAKRALAIFVPIVSGGTQARCWMETQRVFGLSEGSEYVSNR